MSATVLHIDWLSEEAEEALLSVGDATLVMQVFCQPCWLQVGATLAEPVLAYDSTNIVRAAQELAYARLVRQPFAHECGGKVVDAARGIAVVGSIPVELDGRLPGDIRDGDWIEFSCTRLDCQD